MQAKKLTEPEIHESLSTLSGWERKEGPIAKEYRFGDFKEALRFVTRVADLAESADHHPEILIRYNKVRLTLTTHSAGGLTDKDFALARQVDVLPAGS